MTGADLFLYAWRFDPVAPVGCATAALGYATCSRLRRSTDGSNRVGARFAFLTTAVILLVVATASPLGTLADGYLFSAHMLQHLLLLLVVPPLALLSLSPSQQPTVPSPARNPASHVPAAWLGGVAAMWLWHAPLLCNAASRSAGVHLLQEVSLLALGTWFFWPILAPHADARLPPLAGIAYLLTGCLACTLLGVAVTFSPVEICAAYLFPADRLGILPLLRGSWGLTPTRDQQIGGLLMWLPACLVYGTAILGILARWYGEPEANAPSQPTAEEGH
jgi:putative membrane protein